MTGQIPEAESIPQGNEDNELEEQVTGIAAEEQQRASDEGEVLSRTLIKPDSQKSDRED